MNNYKLPLCWRGRVMDDGHVILQSEVNEKCHCLVPLSVHFCMEGHLTGCHAGMSCSEAKCSHYDVSNDEYLNEENYFKQDEEFDAQREKRNK